MGRASGRKNEPRSPQPGTPEADYTGESARQYPGEIPYSSPIPGGSTGGKHLTNQRVVRQKVPVAPPKPEYRGMTAHGVPAGPETTRDRAESVRGPNDLQQPVPRYDEPREAVAPVPVYVVEPQQGARPLRTIAGDHFTVPAKTSDPIRIAGRDLDRSEIMLLVETAAGSAGAAPQGVRVDHEVGNLTNGGGFLIPAGTTSYQRFNTNDELFAVSTDASACTLSVAYLYGVAGAG